MQPKHALNGKVEGLFAKSTPGGGAGSAPICIGPALCCSEARTQLECTCAHLRRLHLVRLLLQDFAAQAEKACSKQSLRDVNKVYPGGLTANKRALRGVM